MIKKKRIILVIVVLLVIWWWIARYLLPQYERSKSEDELSQYEKSKCLEERKNCVRMQEIWFNIACMPCD